MTNHLKHKPNGLILGVVLAIALGTYSAAQAQERTQRGEDVFAAADANGDSAVTFDEFSAVESGRLARLDSDDNGALSLDEFLSAGPAHGQRPPRGAGEELSAAQQKRLAAREAKMQERRAKLQSRVEERFNEMDSNGDELVSSAEFLEASFLRLDTDNNGALTAAELKAGAPKQRKGGGGMRGGRGENGDRGRP